MLKILIPRAYELNRSAIRSDIRIRHAWYIEHLNALGSCPDYMLLEASDPYTNRQCQRPFHKLGGL